MSVESTPEYFTQALAMSGVLTDVVRREVTYDRILNRITGKKFIPEYVHGQHQLLRWASNVYIREITAMGFGYLAEDAVMLGHDAAMEKFINKK